MAAMFRGYRRFEHCTQGKAMLYRNRITIVATLCVAAICGHLLAQNPAPPGAQPPAGGRGAGMRSAYPQRPPADPAVVERGRGAFAVNCAFCHGSDARGGEGGPNLLRSQMLLNDKQGEGITAIVQNGRPDNGMPKFNFTGAQIAEIAEFLHTIPVGGRDTARQTPINIVVGSADAGKAFFDAKCGKCHSAAGDLKGIASKAPDPKTLQQTWIMPNAGRGGRGAAPANVRPTTVTVTPASGPKVEGRLGRIDDFLVTLTDADGKLRSFPRKGDQPRVEVHDPLQPHLDLLPVYTDKDIHDVTAYLVTLK
jgi:cytochrome c oxidase cbb3-type subunit 3